jgi:hypothetical protein
LPASQQHHTPNSKAGAGARSANHITLRGDSYREQARRSSVPVELKPM